MADPAEVMVLVGRLLFWLVATLYYMVEALVRVLVPRGYLRKDVEGDVALVTGGGSGIGRLMCLRLAARGTVLHLGLSDEETARGRQRRSGPPPKTVYLCDRTPLTALTVRGGGKTTKAFLGDMMGQNKGHVVTIASMAGKVGGVGLVDYCASKFAAVGFHETLTAELKAGGKHGVKTTCVCPIVISTGMFEGAETKYFPTLEPSYVADEVVDAVLMDVPTLYLPHYMWTMPLLPLLLPQKSVDHLGQVMEIDALMKHFVGRRKAE
ncbi:Epidermal retinol dehydrogenase 2 [Chionoecetes opilio]|uniref:Epidermal retinol dehydrogenase 2 n=1 Tax=Chionoecetes opilio TaxID=41210 RepID=A0A8J4XZ88_CHIOP|nr:Epidermal retinol dehydrogenase 2 [Chionoecetes opilio]